MYIRDQSIYKIAVHNNNNTARADHDVAERVEAGAPGGRVVPTVGVPGACISTYTLSPQRAPVVGEAAVGAGGMGGVANGA